MDADRAGAWAPFALAALLLTLAAWGLAEMPTDTGETSAESEFYIPRFIEHFPNATDEAVPDDGLLRLAWHPEDSALGTLKTEDRFTELGEQDPVNHPAEPTNATLSVSVRWAAADTLNISIDFTHDRPMENGILRLILVQPVVQSWGEPNQNAVVRQYDASGIGNNSSLDRTLVLDKGLTITDAEDLRLVVLVSDYVSEENHALLQMPLPIEDALPTDGGAKAGAWIGLFALFGCLAAVVRAEWKREVMLPRLSSLHDAKGRPTARLTAGVRAVRIKEVRVLAPWRLASKVNDLELQAGQERVLRLKVRPDRGVEGVPTSSVQTEWSIEVEELGAWVLDLELPPPRT